MAKYVPDVKSQRWVVLSPARAFRPRQIREEESTLNVVVKNGLNYRADCPFCKGNEAMTPPEITRVTDDAGNWLIRVVPNKYPITDVHEVIIHSPDHKKDIFEMTVKEVRELFKLYQKRYLALRKEGTVLIFNNKGIYSGESLLHPHTQIVVIPSKIVIDVLSLEQIRNPVLEEIFFVAYCPDFSQWPYEVWVTLKEFNFGILEQDFTFRHLTEEQLEHLADTVQKIISKLLAKFPDISYNFYIYPYSPFYLRIIPRLISKAGFELGTGLNVNVVDPVIAAEELKK